jgi:hypothetical protein
MCKEYCTRWRVELEWFIQEVTSYSMSGYGRVHYVQYSKVVHYVTSSPFTKRYEEINTKNSKNIELDHGYKLIQYKV